jgi:hypothetical protein
MLFNPTSVFVTHKGQSGRGLSPRIWQKVKSHMASPDGSGGKFIYDDFLQFQGFTNAISGTTALPSTTIPSPEGYKIYVDSATTASGVSRLATEPGGVARFAPGATDNHLAILGAGIFGELSRTAGEEKLTAFEARVRLHTQVTSGSTFIGWGTDTLVADGGLIADAGGLLATGAGIGFRTKEDDPDGIDVVYQAASQTEQVVKNVAKVIAADTFVKLGWVFDPRATASERISFYVDNEDVGSYVTDTNMAAATFPNSVLLGPVIAAMTQATTTRGLDVDWWACYQED